LGASFLVPARSGPEKVDVAIAVPYMRIALQSA
jgi:hypothetical protein